jgi:methionine synthase II (cobalamin-independent)
LNKMQRDLPPFCPFAPITLVRYCSRFRSNKRAPSMWPDNYPQPALTAIEDAEIKKIIAKQETIGLRSVSNGELRRAYWHFDFLAGLDGVEMVEAQGIKFAGVTSKAEAPYVKGKLGSHHHPQIAHFEFLKANTKRNYTILRNAKCSLSAVTIPTSRAILAQRQDRRAWPDNL